MIFEYLEIWNILPQRKRAATKNPNCELENQWSTGQITYFCFAKTPPARQVTGRGPKRTKEGVAEFPLFRGRPEDWGGAGERAKVLMGAWTNLGDGNDKKEYVRSEAHRKICVHAGRSNIFARTRRFFFRFTFLIFYILHIQTVLARHIRTSLDAV